jgi:hypothetical protein
MSCVRGRAQRHLGTPPHTPWWSQYFPGSHITPQPLPAHSGDDAGGWEASPAAPACAVPELPALALPPFELSLLALPPVALPASPTFALPAAFELLPPMVVPALLPPLGAPELPVPALLVAAPPTPALASLSSELELDEEQCVPPTSSAASPSARRACSENLQNMREFRMFLALCG